MKHISIGLIFSLFLATAHLAAKPNLSFKHFKAKDGISSSRIMGMFQDSQGFMWFATVSGLSRFDGHIFKNYKHDPNNPTSISDNQVLDILEDKQGFLWISTLYGLNRFNPVTEKFIHYFHDKNDSNSLSDNRVFKILQDGDGNIWAGTTYNGLNRYDPETEKFVRYHHNESDVNSLNHDSTAGIYIDKNGNLLVGTGKGIARYEPAEDHFTRFSTDDSNSKGINELNIRDITEGPKGDLWFSTYNDGLFRFSQTNQKLIQYPLVGSNGPNVILTAEPSDLLLDSQGELWVGSDSGLHWYDKANDKFIRYGHNENDTHSLGEDIIISLYEDKSGEIWVGFLGAGMDLLSQQSRTFSYYRYDPNDFESVSDNQITALLETNNGNLWIGTNNGLNRYRAENNLQKYFNSDTDKHSLIDNQINTLLEDNKGRVWVGTNHGLNRFDENINGFVRYIPNPAPSSLFTSTNNYVRSLLEDNQGNIWMGTFRGLYQFNPFTEKFVTYRHDKSDPNSLSFNNPRPLLQDKNGTVWIGTDTHGLNRFNPKNATFSHYRHEKKNKNSITHDHINALFEDKEGLLWIGTNNGLSRLNSRTNNFMHFNEFVGKKIGTILSDDKGFIWVGTTDNLSQFDNRSETFKHYDSSNVLYNRGFHNGIKLSNGELIFGGVDGLIRFDPNQLQDSLQPPDIVFTDFLLFNHSVPIGRKTLSEEKHKPKTNSNLARTSFVLNKAINKTKKLTLTHEESLFTFEFSALHYANSKKNQYAYKLEGLDNEWIYTDYNNRRATYTSIPSGDYTLRVKGSNSDGIWNETGASIELTILPPPWLSWWAYTIYITVALCLILLVATLAYKRKIAEKEKLAALSISSAKENLFANISHEFRTPLTLILGPSASIKQKTNNQEIKSDVSLIERNAQRLLHMVDQVLDLAKLRGAKDQAKINQNVSAIVEFLVHSFQSLVEEQQIELSIDYSTKDELYTSMVPDALTKILTNLLSNAFKYTPPGGKVIIRVNKDSHHNLLLSIKDTGCGISPEDQPTIFERFTRLQKTEDSVSGTGIGLALVKQLVESHQGTITVTSKLEVGSEFTVRLPLAEDLHGLPDSMSQASKSYVNEMVENINIERLSEVQHENHSETLQNNSPLVLIIEDNKDMRHFIRNAIKSDYNVITASDGEAGVKLAIERVPDLIISDVMMPKMDGYEVARTLKSNHITSHIPLVLLTAKGDNQSRIRGWQENVDEYLTKPFDSEELLIRMNNLLSIRELLRERFNQQLQSTQPVSLTKVDDSEEDREDWISAEQQFMERYNQVLNKYFSEPNLKVGTIAQALHMTERQLSRKIKSLLNSTPSSYLRNYRLEKASSLLKQGKSIGEVAFSVGFSSHSNFGRYFKAKYGVSPKEYKTENSSSNLN